MIQVAIADDQLLFRKGLAELINKFTNCRVVLEAADGASLLEQLQHSEEIIDVVLLDISMPGMNGLEALQQIKIQFPYIKNIMLSVHDEEKYIVKLIDAGANAYLAKNTHPQEIELAIHTVIEKDFYFNASTIAAMRNGFKYNKNKILLQQVDTLSKREKEILLLICKELSTLEIANLLFLSERTIDGHRLKLLQKTDAKNTAGLVVFAIKNALFDVDG